VSETQCQRSRVNSSCRCSKSGGRARTMYSIPLCLHIRSTKQIVSWQGRLLHRCFASYLLPHGHHSNSTPCCPCYTETLYQSGTSQRETVGLLTSLAAFLGCWSQCLSTAATARSDKPQHPPHLSGVPLEIGIRWSYPLADYRRIYALSSFVKSSAEPSSPQLFVKVARGWVVGDAVARTLHQYSSMALATRVQGLLRARNA
jgi:hypothetical protein